MGKQLEIQDWMVTNYPSSQTHRRLNGIKRTCIIINNFKNKVQGHLGFPVKVFNPCVKSELALLDLPLPHLRNYKSDCSPSAHPVYKVQFKHHRLMNSAAPSWSGTFPQSCRRDPSSIYVSHGEFPIPLFHPPQRGRLPILHVHDYFPSKMKLKYHQGVTASGCGSTHLVEDPGVLISGNCKLYLGPTPP